MVAIIHVDLLEREESLSFLIEKGADHLVVLRDIKELLRDIPEDYLRKIAWDYLLRQRRVPSSFAAKKAYYELRCAVLDVLQRRNIRIRAL